MAVGWLASAACGPPVGGSTGTESEVTTDAGESTSTDETQEESSTGELQDTDATTTEADATESEDSETTGPPPVRCTDELPPLSLFVSMSVGFGTMRLADTNCPPCECFDDQPGECSIEIGNVPAAPGVYPFGEVDVQASCIVCIGGPGNESDEGDYDNSGTIEIVSVAESGVVGCLTDACGGEYRFEATWCP